MGIAADDLGYAVDVMAKAMTTANTDLTMLGEAFKFVGPMARSSCLSLEEITAALQLLSNASVQRGMAGTTLRGMLLSLTAPSAEAAKEQQHLGVRVPDARISLPAAVRGFPRRHSGARSRPDRSRGEDRGPCG
jgi:TP901 family phage tail tape measure protein